MKKFMTASLCVLASVLAFSACTGKNVIQDVAENITDNVVTDVVSDAVDDLVSFAEGSEQGIIGMWKCEKDMTDMVNEQLAADLEGVTLDSFTVLLNLDINADTMTMTAELDPASVEAFGNATLAYAKNMFAAEGIDMSDDEIAEMMDIEGMKAELADEFVSELDNETSAYCVEGNKLITVDENGNKEEDDFVYFELDGDTLTLTGTAETGEEIESMFPLVFKRA